MRVSPSLRSPFLNPRRDNAPGDPASHVHFTIVPLSFNAESVDTTHAESAGRWRELLDGAGIKRAAVAGRGLFKDAASDALMRQTFFDGAVKTFQVIIPDFGTVAGPFQITSFEFAGQHDGELTYELALESAGELTFVAA